MKKLFALLLCSAFLMVLSCEDEPLEGDFGTGGLTCEVAVANTTQAALNFLSVNVDNYTQLCIAYRNALQEQILACGDADGSLQAAVNALGDCSDGVENDCDSAQAAVDNAEFAFDNATADNYTSLCNAYKVALENEIVQCGDDDGSIQAEIDALGDCIFVNPPLYEIGDIGPAGGFVFYVAPNGGGMEIAPISTQFQSQWGCYSTDITGTQSAFGTGISNSELILMYHNDIDFYNNPEQCQAVDPISGILVQSTGDVAAKHCDDFVFNGFNDWYLPSIDELHLAYVNLHTQGLGDFSTTFLASSTQDPENHWEFLIVDFDDNGVIWGDGKSDLVNYRAIRSF
ncbi:hypothetical protein WNY78_13880 [Psychroserpens sp. AS72]|uniref:hypothetical protein n=1 Tax=Psychroserpens sp. AS72 TaxID=3135775 RepID=UPI00317CCD99